MKKFLKLVFIFLVFTNCTNNDDHPASKNEKSFLVDKIYDYNGQLLAQYIYDKNNRLTKRITTDPVNKRSSDYIFEYENNDVKKIIYIDYNFPQFNHEILIYYDKNGKIIRDETLQKNKIISHNNYSYNSEGKINYVFKDNGSQNSFVDYQNSPNCKQVKYLIPHPYTGELNESFSNFLFDTKKKPPFGIDKIFQIEILPYFGDESLLPRNISANNMTEFVSGTKWFYEYNEDNLPKTIETKWKNVITEEPMLLKIFYKKIK